MAAALDGCSLDHFSLIIFPTFILLDFTVYIPCIRLLLIDNNTDEGSSKRIPDQSLHGSGVDTEQAVRVITGRFAWRGIQLRVGTGGELGVRFAALLRFTRLGTPRPCRFGRRPRSTEKDKIGDIVVRYSVYPVQIDMVNSLSTDQ